MATGVNGRRHAEEKVAARQTSGGLTCVPSCKNLSTASTRHAMYV